MISITNSLGIIILNPESDPSSVRITAKTARDHFPEANIKCVVGKQNADLSEIKKHCSVVIGGNTITSLMDVGIASLKEKWCLFVTTGTFLRYYSLRRHQYFCRSEFDILFPVVNKKWTFDEATINGLLMPTQAQKDVGILGEDFVNIKLAKLVWGMNAIEKGYIFKAVVGGRFV